MKTDKYFFKMLGCCVLTVVICCVVNNVLKHHGIEWLNAYPFALGCYISRIYHYKREIEEL